MHRARDRNAGELGGVRVAADGEDVAPDPLAIEQIPHARDDERGGQGEPGNGAEHRGVAERLHACGHAVERLRAGDAEIDPLEDREAGERDDERRNAGRARSDSR